MLSEHSQDQLNKLFDRMKNRITTCPVCGDKEVRDDVIAHGPGIAVVGYTCGCEVHSDEEGTVYYSHNGTIVEVEKEQ